MGNSFPFPGEAWMPWKECSVVDERLRFVAQLLDGEAMSEVCRAFGISRKTGYKIFERYKEHGLEALTDRSRRPVRYGELHPEPLTDPDLILSHHPARATVRRLPPSVACQVPPVAG
jgi:transposase-like protein